MKLSSGKISNYIGQAKNKEDDARELDSHLVYVDKDLSNIWQILNTLAPFVGTLSKVLATNTTLDFTYAPTMAANPTGTPTAYTGHAAMVFCTSNSNFYIFNSSDNNWKTVALT